MDSEDQITHERKRPAEEAAVAVRWMKEHVISVAADASSATGQAATSYGIHQPCAYLGFCEAEKPYDWAVQFRSENRIFTVKGIYLKSAIPGKTVSVALSRIEEPTNG